MVHAEENLIANCAKHGISTDNCMVVLTMSPCVRCMRLLYQAGIKQVVVKNKYRDFEDIKQMADLEIKETNTPEGYFKLEYVPRKA
jgi:dCMP deaminase